LTDDTPFSSAAAGEVQRRPDADIIIVGGALVGGTLALALARLGHRVLLADAQPLAPESIGVTTRGQAVPTTAVAAGSRKILSALIPGLDLANIGTPILGVHVSQRGYFGATRLDARDQGLDALGYVVRNRDLVMHFSQALSRAPGLTLRSPLTLTSLSTNNSVISANFAGEKVTAKLLIGVDGADSAVRRCCDITLNRTDYGQSAVVATLQTELDHEHIAYERFTAAGPLALLPLGKNTHSLIMTVEAVDVEAVMGLSDAAFLQRVQAAFGFRLGRMEKVCGERQAFPLILQQAGRQSAERVLLLGNAARSLHPVAGQGYNLAVRDIGKLIELLGAAASTGLAGDDAVTADPGAAQLLSAFSRARESDQRDTVRLTDFFARGFRGSNTGLSLLRGLGLITVNMLPVARRRLARRAMGLSVALPDLHYPF